MPEQPSGLELRARLLTIAFERLLPVLRGAERIANIPKHGYIRTVQVNMATQCFELMLIDAAFEPVKNLGDMPTIAAECVPVTPPKGKRK